MKMNLRYHKTGKILTMLLSAAILLPQIPGTQASRQTQADAAATLQLSHSSLTVTQGKTAKLKLKTPTGMSNEKVTWTSSRTSVAKVTVIRRRSVKVYGIHAGKTVITAKSKKKTARCKVTVNAVKKGTVLYNLEKERGKNVDTGESLAPPIVCDYKSFRYNTYAIWICPFSFYDPSGISADFRGQKIKVSLTVQNTGARDLPELGVCFNYANGCSGEYPYGLHISSKILPARIRSDSRHKNAAMHIQNIAKGKTYTWNFTYTIPKKAQHLTTVSGSTGSISLPITIYISNLRDESVYRPGDEITVRKCVIRTA